MQTFRDVFIHGEISAVLDFIRSVTDGLEAPWKRSYENEENAKYIGEVAFCFEREEDSRLPAAGLSIYQKDDATWYIPNVVPIKSGRLSYDNYNGIISEFYESYLEPYSTIHSVDVEITSGELRDGDIVGDDAAELLKRFSSCANKSTGSSHPMDKERWFAFLVAAGGSQLEIDTGNLRRLLEQQGWSEEQSQDLIIEFEFGRDLIKYMEK